MQLEERDGRKRHSFTTNGYRFTLDGSGKVLAFSGTGDPPWKILLRSIKSKKYTIPPLSDDDYRSTLLSVGMGSMTRGHYRAFREQLDKSLQRAPDDIRKSIAARRAEAAENEKSDTK
ncbi:MAG: hypothetical protein J5J00_14310 [Deltaproteobacteria bacterium]|nr:hypothetical protein [Deltaproteobacteria bacterium]